MSEPLTIVKPSEQWSDMMTRAAIEWAARNPSGERYLSVDDVMRRCSEFETFACSHLDVLTDAILAKLSHGISTNEQSAYQHVAALKAERLEVCKLLALNQEVYDSMVVIDLATRRMEEYRQMAERFMALESAAAHQPRPVAVKDETWIAKTTTVRIGESLQYKRIKITGVQPAAGGLPARYRFTVLNPGDKMQTGSSCSEESLLGHYVREQQPSLPGTDDRVISVDTSDGSRSLTPPAPASPISVTTGPAGEMIIGLPVNPAEGTAVIIDGATRTATVSYPKPASDAAVGLP